MASFDEAFIATMNAITSAFAGVSREGGVSLHEAEVLDDYGSDEERAEARTKDVDIQWQDVPDSSIEGTNLSLIFLDAIGFRYYIPAYMMWEMRQIARKLRTNTHVRGLAIFTLTFDEQENEQQWKLARLQIFNQQQSRAICRFLRFCAKYDDEFGRRDALNALERGWSKRC